MLNEKEKLYRMLERRNQIMERQKEKAEQKIEAKIDMKVFTSQKKEKKEQYNSDIFHEHYSPLRKHTLAY